MTNLKFGARVDNNGDINASSKKDLMKLQASVLTGTASKEEKVELKAAFDAAIKAGAKSDESVKFGAAFAGALAEQVDREGFMRAIFVEQPTVEGAPVSIQVNQKNSVAVITTGSGVIRSQLIQDKFLYPSEFTIGFSATMQKVDLHRTPGDRVQKMYQDALEAIMVREDRTAKKMIDKMIADAANEVDITASEITPKDIGAGITFISEHGGAPAITLMSYTVMNDILTGTSFANFFNPIANMELVKTGRLGELFGTMIMTDAARSGNMKVLNPGECYILNRADLLGAFTDRAGIESAEINGIANPAGGFSSVRGWNLEEIMSMTVFNDKGAYKLIKE